MEAASKGLTVMVCGEHRQKHRWSQAGKAWLKASQEQASKGTGGRPARMEQEIGRSGAPTTDPDAQAMGGPGANWLSKEEA